MTPQKKILIEKENKIDFENLEILVDKILEDIKKKKEYKDKLKRIKPNKKKIRKPKPIEKDLFG
jgi:hypothetical protein